jgi:ADP-heptose:LPS heptosyltransferase
LRASLRHRRLPAGRSIGLAWAGSTAGQRLRNVSFAKLAPLLATPDVTFVGLQHFIAVTDVEAVAAARNFINLGPTFQDFADTAAVVAQLDMVIGVDASVVHLAGAMGRPVSVMLKY